jgi:hypothetical protein
MEMEGGVKRVMVEAARRRKDQRVPGSMGSVQRGGDTENTT